MRWEAPNRRGLGVALEGGGDGCHTSSDEGRPDQCVLVEAGKLVIEGETPQPIEGCRGIRNGWKRIRSVMTCEAKGRPAF